MKLIPLKLKGSYEVIPEIIGDERGYFTERYKADKFEETGLNSHWIQENQSFSTEEFTIRGLHFQAPPFAQSKLVTVCTGSVLDVIVDIRTSSPTYGHWDSLELSAERCNGIYVPRGFAHGFCTLEENVIVQYKVDNSYSKLAEGGINWNDPDLAISWPTDQPLLSDKDCKLENFAVFESPF